MNAFPSKIDFLELNIQQDKSPSKELYIPKGGIKAYVLAIHLWDNESYQIRLFPLFTISEEKTVDEKKVKRFNYIKSDGNLPLHSDNNFFALNHCDGKLSFHKILNVQPDFLIGYDLGTYCMRSMAKWAKDNFDSEMPITPLTLHTMGSETPEALKRRNKFYIRSGFNIVPSSHHEHEDINDPEKIAIGSAKAKVGDLKIADLRTKVISIVSNEGANGLLALSRTIENGIGMDLLEAHQKLETLSNTLNYKNEKIEELKNNRYRQLLYIAASFFISGYLCGVFFH